MLIFFTNKKFLILIILFICRREFTLDQEVMASGYSKDVKMFDAEFGVGEKHEEGENELEEEEGDSKSEGEYESDELEFDEREEIAAEQDENNETEEKGYEKEELLMGQVDCGETESKDGNDFETEVYDNSEILSMQQEMEHLGLKDLEKESKPPRVLTKKEMKKADKNKDSDTKSVKSNQSRLSEADQQMFKGVLLNHRKEAKLARERGEKEPDLWETLSNLEFENGSKFSMRTSITESDIAAAKKKLARERMKKEKVDERHKKLKKVIKGNANSVRRGIKENKNIIKQYSGWDDFKY